MATWFDIKLRSLQKMFGDENGQIPQNTATQGYLASMPGACNEALQLLATVGKFVIKKIEIAHNPVKNLLSGTERISSVEGGSISFSAVGAKSMYFEATGDLNYVVTVGDTIAITGSVTSNSYVAVKKLISNPQNSNVVITFTSDYPMAIKNMALYGATFHSDSEVQSYAEKVRYDLRKVAPDFYQLADDAMVLESGSDTTRYAQTSDYFQEGNTVLVLDRDLVGNFTIFYKAYPHEITSTTPDDYVFECDPEVVALIPLYIASELYQDDDIAIATQYRNKFEEGMSLLKNRKIAPSAEEFVSAKGWI